MLFIITYNIGYFVKLDWQSNETFYQFIYVTLLITIGLELARMLITHNFLAILELLAFVVARKMLKHDNITSVDVLLCVVAFVAILASYRFLIIPIRDKIKSKR